MPRPDQTPRLSKLPFLVGDLLLLAVAAFIIQSSPRPIGGTALIAVVSCVALAAILGTIPFITDYARKQDEALDERQRALEALGATVSASAEQISIAANGLHEMAELVQKKPRTADQLPHQLQEKIGELTAQLAHTRAAESDRLAATAAKIEQTSADLAKLEAASRQHLATAKDALAQLASSSSRHLSELAATTTTAIAQAQAAAAAVLDRKFAAAERTFEPTRVKLPAELDAKSAATTADLAAAPRPSEPPAEPIVAVIPKETLPPVVVRAAISTPAAAPSSENSTPSTLSSELIAPASLADSPTPEPPVAVAAPRKRAPKKPATRPALEPAPALEASPPEAPNPASPLPVRAPEIETRNSESPRPADEFIQFSPDELPLPSPAPEPSVNPIIKTQDPEPPSTAATTDGATRLLVTAYIGIGNRLFIRGTGPGLSWEKGVPLQFVSIGKWRWETPDATAAVTLKIYKNDSLECTALGELTLSPANQTEVTATF